MTVSRLAACCLLATAADAAELDLSPCDLTATGGRQEVDATCGTLAVPLDPNDPGGETIELFVAVVEALADQPLPDPLVVIAGGPGEAATRFYAMAEAAFSRIVRDRDIILVDQRGTGRSAPLRCDNGQDDLFLSAGSVQSMIDTSRECLAGLSHDPRFFTTSVAVRDLDAAREALGYAELNLYGISYGTRVAQHYLRRFPGSTRRVILDGVLPPDVALGPDVALASQTALDALFDRCAADDGCRRAFPGLRLRFDAVLAREDPVEVTLDHPRTGHPVDVVVDHWMLVGVVRLLVYQPQSASLLPVLIDAAHGGDYRDLATQAFLLTESVVADRGDSAQCGWSGMIETPPDVVPVIDEADGLSGFHIATGFSGHGFGIGAGAGKAIAGSLTGNDVGLDVREFRLGRFSDGTPIRSKASG